MLEILNQKGEKVRRNGRLHEKKFRREWSGEPRIYPDQDVD